MPDLRETCELALDHFGATAQINKAIEEMSELTTELARYQNGEGMRTNLIGEIADCAIVLTQITLLFGEDLVQSKINEKLVRLMKLMGRESK
jgi:NTP pyrophosphatase (non-canonical NTP hydrolase)